MTFWLIVVGIIAVVLLLAWRADNRSRGTGRFRRRKIYDAVRIDESKQQLNRMQTDRWDPFGNHRPR